MSTKRANGTGCIFQSTKNGYTYWQARITIGYGERGQQKYKTFGGPTREVVETRLNQYIERMNMLGAKFAIGTSLEKWLNIWLEDCVKPTVSVSTYKGYKSMVNAHIIPCIGHISLMDLTKQDVESMMGRLLYNGRALSEGGLDAVSVKKIRSCLVTALNEAMKREYIIRNVALLTAVPKNVKEDSFEFVDCTGPEYVEAMETIAASMK